MDVCSFKHPLTPFLSGLLLGTLIALTLTHFPILPFLSTQSHVAKTVHPNDVTGEGTLELKGALQNPTPEDTILQSTARKGKNGRILCWILTSPEWRFFQGSIAVNVTWGQRCDKLLFMSTFPDNRVFSVAIPKVRAEGKIMLWAKTKNAWEYIWRKHRDDADWFLKADADTYFIVEILREYLNQLNSTQALYIGNRLKKNDGLIKENKGYMHGGAGYILTRETLKRFAETVANNKSICGPKFAKNGKKYRGTADTEMGRCLSHIGGITQIVPKDKKGRERFLLERPEDHQKLSESPGVKDGSCCSDTALSFHKVDPRQIHMLEYLLYRLNVRQDFAKNKLTK